MISSNVLIDLVSALVLAIVLVSNRKQRTEDPGRRLLRGLLWALLLIFALDIPAWMLDGRRFYGARALCYALDTGYYAMQIVYCYLWLLFMDWWICNSHDGLKKRMLPYAVPMLLELVVIGLNPFTGWIFTIDPNNVYARGAFYLVNLIPYYLYILGAMLLAALGGRRSETRETKPQRALLFVYMLLPICGAIVETMQYGVAVLWPFTMLSLLMVNLSVKQQQLTREQFYAIRQEEKAARLEAELIKSNTAVMLSQIQPHFLYNVLSSIAVACDEDPAAAKQLTIRFAQYLRANLDALSQKEPVSFAKELAHTKTYLAIEAARFEEKLSVTYDVRATEFFLPTMVLQPLVENAVKHGLGKKREGGTIVVRTWQDDAACYIAVVDDGVGFDPTRPSSDDRTHVGLHNVRERLRYHGGELKIESRIGEGTTVTVILHKGGCE